MDADLKEYLEAMERRLNEHVNAKLKGLENGLEELKSGLPGLKSGLERLEDRLVEKMRDMQSELLRAFASSEDQTIRLRKM